MLNRYDVIVKNLDHRKSNKTRQKKFNFSDDVSADVLEARIEDETALTGRGISEIIQGSIIEALMPENTSAFEYTARLYNGLGDSARPYRIRDALSDIICAEAAGVGQHPAHGGDRKIFELARDVCADHGVEISRQTETTGSRESMWPYLVDRWDSVCKIVSRAATTAEGAREEDDPDAREARLILRELECGARVALADPLGLILSSWTTLGIRSVTYRAVSVMLRSAAPWDDTPAERIRFAEVCQEVMSGWEAQDARRDAIEHPTLTSHDFVVPDVTDRAGAGGLQSREAPPLPEVSR